jgi:sec-independent protein translocase protein TatB
MFDFAWSEILLIGAVALIAIGPKDMPAAIRAVSGMVKKARRMAAEFQTHVDEMVREADLGDVKKAFTDIRNLDLQSALEKHVDPDSSLRKTFNENPFNPKYPEPLDARTMFETPVAELPAAEAAPEPPVAAEPAKPLAPAWVPPGMVPPPPIEPAAAVPAEPPSWVPPDAALARQPRT